jgi:hypothetical protein
MITRCEYCRQMSDGLECRKCGAPLPGLARSVARLNTFVGGKLFNAARILEHLGESDPEGALREWQLHCWARNEC